MLSHTRIIPTRGQVFKTLGAGLCVIVPLTLHADLFDLTLETEGTVTSQGYSDIGQLFDQLTDAGLAELTAAYTPTSAATVTLGVRGLPAIAEYEANSPTLNFVVPSLGIDLAFQGATRDESQDLFTDFMEGAGGSILTQLLQGFVSQTAVDPVAGNPNSLMANMASSDFYAVTDDVDIDGKGPLSGDRARRRLLGVKLIAGNSEATGFRTKMISVPINYIVPLSNPQYQLIFDMPIRYLDVEGASAYDASFGIGLRIPLAMRPVRWSITPLLRAGIVKSENAGALQAIYSQSATSRLKYSFNDLELTLNNMVGFYQTGSVAGDYDGEYDLRNTIFRNGLSLSGSLAGRLFDEPTTWEVEFVDTRITGDAWFIDVYHELALTFGTIRRENRMTWQSLRVGAKYVFADEYDGLQFVLGYRF